MEGELNEQFSQEELDILGEEVDPEESTGDDTEETGESEEEASETEQAAEKESESATDTDEDEGKDPVQKRIDTLTFEKNETQRKFDLFKTLGPEEYYKKFPDEKPEGSEEGVESDTAPSFGQAANMVVQGGPYDGKTLKEVYDVDPFSAIDIYQTYRDGIVLEQRKTEAEEERFKREAEEDIERFTGNLSKELYEKDIKDLDDKEKANIDKVLDQVMEFINDPKNGTTNLDLAYLYLNKDDLLSKAALEGAKGLTERLKQGSAKTVKIGSGDALTGYDAYMQLTPAQLASKIDNMTNAQMKKFINEAPDKMKSKFPAVDWDPL